MSVTQMTFGKVYQPPKTKVCPTCGENRIEEFGKYSRRSDGLRLYCKKCESARSSAYYHQNEEVAKLKRRERYAEQTNGQETFIPQKKVKCSCHDYTHCILCRNAERWRAFKAGEVPEYLRKVIDNASI